MPYSQTSSFELEQDAAGIDTSTPPSSPSDADVHVVGRGATGAFYLKDDWLATWNAAQGVWAFEKPIHGQRVHASGVWLEYDAVACIWKNSEVLGVAKVGLTASTTQTQGQGAAPVGPRDSPELAPSEPLPGPPPSVHRGHGS